MFLYLLNDTLKQKNHRSNKFIFYEKKKMYTCHYLKRFNIELKLVYL
jgi:hypothetical protein